ncbi:MAG: Bcr/CflA family drug resistance efflux transporter, partial [Myxococcota bacterium]
RPRALARSYRTVLSNRVTAGYMLASGTIFAALFAFLSTSEQIFRDVFKQGDRFALWFGTIAIAMSGASFLNARLVERVGMRRLSQLSLVGFISTAALLLVLTWTLGPRLEVFVPLFAVVFAQFGLIGANFSALAMEPVGQCAGTAAAAYGFATTTVAAAIGGVVAGSFDGTLFPVLLGYVGLGFVCLLFVAVAERGRLFVRA